LGGLVGLGKIKWNFNNFILKGVVPCWLLYG
jgi:hypothetical protein